MRLDLNQRVPVHVRAWDPRTCRSRENTKRRSYRGAAFCLGSGGVAMHAFALALFDLRFTPIATLADDE